MRPSSSAPNLTFDRHATANTGHSVSFVKVIQKTIPDFDKVMDKIHVAWADAALIREYKPAFDLQHADLIYIIR